MSVSAELLAGRASLIALRQQDGWQVAASHGIEPSFLRRVNRMLADIPRHSDSKRHELPEVNRRLQRITQITSMGLLTGVGLPLIAREEVIGVIFVFRSYIGGFSSQDRALLQAFASQAAIAVQNARLYTEVSQQKQHLASIVDSSADGIFILDRNLRFTRFNRACTRITGYEEAEVQGVDHGEIIRWIRREPGDTLEEARQAGWPTSALSTFYVEGELARKRGGTISVGITYAPTLSDGNHLLSIVGNIRDITKFREAEELKSTFISVISHELRTPVALIKGYVGTLRREDARWDPGVVRDSLAVIEEEADRLSALIDDLLDASRLQTGALALNKSRVAVDELARELAERFATQSDRHSFSASFPPHFPPVPADPERLTQLISNLLSNAVKFSPEGGHVKIQGQFSQREIEVCVQDEGPGIAREDVPHIFDRFYRSKEASDKTKGAGLGLYLAKAIAEAHEGRIWVDDRTTTGTRICFSIPLI